MIARGMRYLLMGFGGLTLLAFVALFVGATRTDQYFAWTIKPAASAAFLGAAYGAGCVMVLLALRSGTWSSARIPYLAVYGFTLLTLLATLLHLDRFHFRTPGAVPSFAAWLWLAVYVVVPVTMTFLLILSRSSPGPARARPIPMTWPVRAALVLQGGAFLLVGLVLFVVPRTQSVLWPWTLTPLTARAVGSWLLAFGVAALLALRVGDLGPLGVIAAAYGTLAVLELAVLWRFSDQVRWGSAASWVYLAMLATMGALSVSALSRRVRAPA